MERPGVTLICVPIPVDAPDAVGEALERAADAASRGADLVEWRADVLAEDPQALGALRRLVRESPRPCITTIRIAAEGGMFEGSESDRISLLEALGTSEPPEIGRAHV